MTSNLVRGNDLKVVLGNARKHWMTSLLRAVVFVLFLPLVTAGALPSWALLVSGEPAHVCHCSIEQHDCACPKCHPDQEDDLRLSSEAISGRCGDDGIAFFGKALGAALASPSSVVPAPVVRIAFIASVLARPSEFHRRPPTPPPRFSSSPV